MNMQHFGRSWWGALVVVAAVAGFARGAIITQTAPDGAGQSGFTQGARWSNSAVPSSGNDYETAVLLRTPASGSSFTFGGDSLTIKSGGGLAFVSASSNTTTVNNLTVESGGNIGTSRGDTAVTLAGNGITSVGYLTWTTNTFDTLTRHATVTAPIGGSGGIRVANKSDNMNSSSGITNGSLTLSANNTFTGGVTIYGAVLKVGNAGALNSTNPNLISFSDGSPGYFNTNGFSVAVRGLQTGTTVGTPTVQNANATAATLTLKPKTGDTYTYASVIQNGTGGGALSITKDGAGTQILSGLNTYTGNTTISLGKLLANNASGSATGTGNVIINGGTFGGSGIVSGTVTLNSGGTIAPGASIESLATGGNTWNGGGDFNFEFSTDGSTGTAGSQWDLLSITGGLDLSGASSSNKVTLNLFTMSSATTQGLLGTWDPNTDHTWAGFVTTTTGVSSFAADKFLIDATGFQNTINGSFGVVQNGNNLDLVYTAVVPEPGTFAMLLFGSVMLWVVGRKRG